MSTTSMVQGIAHDHAYHLGSQDTSPQILLPSSTVSSTCRTLTNIQNINVHPSPTKHPPPAYQTESSSQKPKPTSLNNLVSKCNPEMETPNISSPPEPEFAAQNSRSLSSSMHLSQDLPGSSDVTISESEKRPSNRQITDNNRKAQPVGHIRCCEKVFSKASDLRKHLELHNGKNSLIVKRKIEKKCRAKKYPVVAKRIGSKKSNLNCKALQNSSHATKSPKTSIQNNNHDSPVQVITASSIWQSMFDTEVPTPSSEMSIQRSPDTNDSQSVMNINKVSLLKTKITQEQREKCQCLNCTMNADNRIRDSNGKPLHVCGICSKVYNCSGSFRQHLMTHNKCKTTVNMNLTVKQIASRNVNTENQTSQNSNLPKTSNSIDFNIQNNNTTMQIITASSIWENMFPTNN